MQRREKKEDVMLQISYVNVLAASVFPIAPTSVFYVKDHTTLSQSVVSQPIIFDIKTIDQLRGQ